jgi:hypothetical protein
MPQISRKQASLGPVYQEPYKNNVENCFSFPIHVIHQLSNRLIGDEMFPDLGTHIQLEGNFYRASHNLLPSGLIGPVLITSQKLVLIN